MIATPSLAPRSKQTWLPWASRKWYQHRDRRGSAYVERVIGSIRRECLDYVIVLNENSLRRTIN
jgi:hypothetical protein